MLLDYEPHSEQHWSPRMRITWRARYKLQPAGPRHPGPFDLDGPGNLRLKQAPQPHHHPQQLCAPHSRKHSFQVFAHCPAFIRSSCLRKSTRARVSLNPIRTEPQRRGDDAGTGKGPAPSGCAWTHRCTIKSQGSTRHQTEPQAQEMLC